MEFPSPNPATFLFHNLKEIWEAVKLPPKVLQRYELIAEQPVWRPNQ